ncbi:MAG: oligosaccharide flippase family protein [bacterium]|nr:oligosaccharide flippase family protein [bacterium]
MSSPAPARPPRSVPARVWHGTGLLVIGRLWGSACTLLTLYLLAHDLSGEGFGRLTFYLALFMLLDSLVDLGTGQVAVQRTASDPDRVWGVLQATRRIRLSTGILGALLVGGGTWLAGESGAGWIFLASLYPITHVLELSTLVFKNQIAWSRPVAVRMVAAGSSLTGVLIGHRLGWEEPALFLFVIAVGSTFGNVLLHLVGRRHLPARKEHGERILPILKAALPIGIAGLCQQAYFYIDNLFVRAIEGEELVGHYNLAVRVMSYGIMLAVYAPLAALPWLTREYAAGRLGPAVTRLAQPMFALAGLGTGLLWRFCEPLLGLFGENFVDAGPSLRWLLGATLGVYVGASLLTGVVAAGRGSSVLGISACALALNLAGNTWLVPRHGIEGAAIATFATEIFVAASAALVLTRAGERLFEKALAWRWIGGPALFILGWAATSIVTP